MYRHPLLVSHRLFDRPDEYSTLLGYMCRDPKELFTVFGLQHHPVYTAALEAQPKSSRQALAKILSCIMYSMDAQSQFTSMSRVAKKRSAKASAVAKKLEAIVGKKPKEKYSYELVARRAAFEHLQRNLGPGKVFSLPPAAAACCSLSAEAAHPLGKAPVGIELEADGDDSGAAQHSRAPLGEDAQDVFMRVVSRRPGNLKVVPVGPADAIRLHLDKHRMCVTFHRVHRDGDNDMICVEPVRGSGAGNALAILAASGDVALLTERLMGWQMPRDGAVVFRFDGVDCRSSIVQRCERSVGSLFSLGPLRLENSRKQFCISLGSPVARRQGVAQRFALFGKGGGISLRLVMGRAFPSGEHSLTVSHDDIESNDELERLTRIGLVDRVAFAQGVSQWRFTEAGVQHLRHYRTVAQPAPVLCLVDRPLALDDATTWELLSLLAEDGWEMQPAPSSKKAKLALAPYATGEPRVWHNSCIDLSRVRHYMIALVRADDLMARGPLVVIHHCCAAKYYKKVLTGTFSGELALLAIEAPARGDGLEADGDDGAAAVPALQSGDPAVVPVSRRRRPEPCLADDGVEGWGRESDSACLRS